ncbi:MAG: molybdopterin-dependent oxidoreductase [Candidatus Dormibacteria bacterium]
MKTFTAAWLGACAGGLSVAAMLAIRLVAGLPSLIEVIGSGAALLLPGAVFGSIIDALQERGRPLLLLGTAAFLIVLAAALAAFMARWSGPRVAAQPAMAAVPRGNLWLRWLAPALVLWLLSLPLLVVAEGGLAISVALSTLADWILLSGLVEIMLGLPRLGGSSAGVRGAGYFGLITRRRFLAASGGALGAVSLGYLGLRVITAQSPPALPGTGVDTAGGGLPPGITPTSDFYVVSKDLFGPPRLTGSSWRLALNGRRSAELGYQELLSMPQHDQVQTLECISNPVGGTLISNGAWSGVRLARVLDQVGIPAGTRTIVFRCADGYSESLPLEEAMASSTLVVTHLNGRILPAQHGFPARILVADRYGMKDPKWLTGISTGPGPFLGYWERQGWNAAALPHIFSRFDFPASSTRLRSGHSHLLTGVAFAGALGVSEVEVSVDGGAHWTAARLQPQLSRFAWSIWGLPWRPQPGLYELSVRATDNRGRVQSAQETGSYPNGASGRQQLTVIVA